MRYSLATALVLLVPSLAAGELEIHFLDVDQGDATFVLGPDGTRVLIDGGPTGEGFTVRSYLNSIGVFDLDYAIATHYHSDHIGGIDEVFNNGHAPDVCYDRGTQNQPSNTNYNQYVASVAGIRQTAFVGQVIPLGDGAEIEVLCVNGEYGGGTINISGSAQLENSASVGTVIRYGDFECYLAGDLTAGGNGTSDVETPVAQLLGQVEVVRSSHHGSNTSSSSSSVFYLDPSFVVHSAGTEADFGHPTKTVVNRWNSVQSSRVQWCTTVGNSNSSAGGFTAVEGHIVVETDGSLFSARPAAGNGPTVDFITWEGDALAPVNNTLEISELLVDPSASSDTFGEWFELVNQVAHPVDLSGLRVSTGSDLFTIRSRVLVDHGAPFLIGIDGQRSRNGDVFVPLGAPWEDFFLSNSGDTLTLLDTSSATTIDAVTWGAGGIAIQSGVSDERVDVFGASDASNFQNGSSSFGGGDQGTPGAVNDADQSVWPAQLAAWPQAELGGALTLRCHSLSEPFALYIAGLSTGFLPGFDAFGVHIPLNVDAIFLATINEPQFFNTLDSSGKREIVIPLQQTPALQGLTLFSNFLTLDLIGFDFVVKKQSNIAALTIQ